MIEPTPGDLPQMLFSCKCNTCAAFPASSMFWWRGNDTLEAGWYCHPCLLFDEHITDEELDGAPRLHDYMVNHMANMEFGSTLVAQLERWKGSQHA